METVAVPYLGPGNDRSLASDWLIFVLIVVLFVSLPLALADLGGGVRDARPPLGVQILSISCSFRENLACSRPPWRVHAPPPSGKSWIRH